MKLKAAITLIALIAMVASVSAANSIYQLPAEPCKETVCYMVDELGNGPTMYTTDGYTWISSDVFRPVTTGKAIIRDITVRNYTESEQAVYSKYTEGYVYLYGVKVNSYQKAIVYYSPLNAPGSSRIAEYPFGYIKNGLAKKDLG